MILVVDDNPLWRTFAKKVLGSASGIEYSETPDDLIEADPHRFGLVICDRVMSSPEWEAARDYFIDRLIRENEACKIIEWTVDDENLHPPVKGAIHKIKKRNGYELEGIVNAWIHDEALHDVQSGAEA
jgi:CheY-like chemotaxis protein